MASHVDCQRTSHSSLQLPAQPSVTTTLSRLLNPARMRLTCSVHDNELHEPHATVADTRAAILKRSKRDIVPVRRSFVQTPRSAAGDATDRSGPLAWFVRSRNIRALQSYRSE